ncbi:phytanoyl-CoA dioxygenase family protein [alpha proteobacterium BAL199]|nr:phytanoyl-CoA dioxygenase family protein [alpha proteobacterium BAL199]
MLSPEQIRFYRESGYVVLENFLSESQLEALQNKTADLTEKSRAVRASDDVYELEDDHSPDRPRLQRIKAPHKVDPVYDGIIRDDRMLAVLRDLLGPSVRLQNSKLNLKSAGGTPVEWHQDWAFYPYTNDDVLAVGVMIDAMTPANGPLMVVPGSHRGEVYSHHRDGWFCGAVDRATTERLLPSAVPFHAPAGSVSFHHARALHGSDINRSGGDRRLLLFEVMAADAWPLAGASGKFTSFEEWHERLLCGEEPERPRMTSVPVRLPQPPAPVATSIFALQRFGDRYYVDRAAGAAGARKEKAAV